MPGPPPDRGVTPCVRLTLTLDRCPLSYSTNPCGADASVTAERCYNTWHTCRARSDYQRGTKKYQFISSHAHLRGWAKLIESYSHKPPALKTSWKLWEREKFTIKMRDFIAEVDAADEDEWTAMRAIKIHQTSWWARFIERNKYFNRRPAVVEIGTISGDQFYAESTHHLVVDNIAYKSGAATITLTDGINISKKDEALCPKPSNIRLLGEIDDSAESTTLKASAVFPAPAPTYVSIDREIMQLTAQASAPAPTAEDPNRMEHTMTVVRAQQGSELRSHDADDTIQDCFFVDGGTTAGVVNVVRDLLENYSDLGAVGIDSDTFNFEDDLFLNLFRVRNVVSKPMGVDEILEELQESCAFRIFYDSAIQKIRLRSIVGLSAEAEHPGYDDNNIIEEKIMYKHDPRKSISSVVFFTRPRDLSDTGKDDGKWRKVYLRKNSVIEAAAARGEAKTLVVYSRWISQDLARSVAERLLLAGGDNEIMVEFEVTQGDGAKLGENVPIQSRRRVDSFGGNMRESYRILRVASIDAKRLKITGQKSIYGALPAGVKYFRLDQSALDGKDILL